MMDNSTRRPLENVTNSSHAAPLQPTEPTYVDISEKENTEPPRPPLYLTLPPPSPILTHQMSYIPLTRIMNFYQYKNRMEQHRVPLEDYFNRFLRRTAMERPGVVPEPPSHLPGDPFGKYTVLELVGYFQSRHIYQVLKKYFVHFVQCQTCMGCTTIVEYSAGRLCKICLNCSSRASVTRRSGIP